MSAESLAEAVDQFLTGAVHARAGAGTQSAYRAALERFFRAAGLETLAQVKELGDFRKALRVLEKESAPATVAHTVSVVRQFYQALQVESPEVKDPTVGVHIQAPDNVPDWNVLKQGDASELIELIPEPRDKAVVLTLVLQGWRVSEFCAMTWKNVRREGERWVVEWKAKRGKMRRQVLQPVVLEALRAAAGKGKKADLPSGPLVLNERGRAYTRDDVYHMVTRYSKKLGRRVTPHGLRATYISSVISRKGIEAARQLAGHRSIATTQRYSRWVVDSDDTLTVEDL